MFRKFVTSNTFIAIVLTVIAMGVFAVMDFFPRLSASVSENSIERPDMLSEVFFESEVPFRQIGPLRQPETDDQKIIRFSSIIEKRQPRLDPAIAEQIAKCTLISSKRYGFPPEMILALMKRESTFIPTLVSSAGCKGLMQVYPEKHLKKLKRRGISKDSPKIFYIAPNIDIGCEILREYYDSAKGNVKQALKQYVGGKHDTYLTDVTVEFTSLMLEKFDSSNM